MIDRRPPRPDHGPMPEGARRRCTMCGKTDLDPTWPKRARTWCSQACVDWWNLAAVPAVAYHELVKLHGHRCWSCHADVEPGRPFRSRRSLNGTWIEQPDGINPPRPQPVSLELEHIRPLWSLDDQERTQLRWWLPFNLQLLCVPCHKAKTAREAAHRAIYRRTGVLPDLLADPRLAVEPYPTLFEVA